jgi:hypothetical protein
MKINQSTQNAIDRNLPIFFITDWGEISLQAQTKQFENGIGRYRRLSKGQFPKVLAYALAIFDAGGVVEFPIHRWWLETQFVAAYGWTPACEPLRTELERRYDHRPRDNRQPQW